MTTNESFTARVPVHLPVRNPVLGLRSPEFLTRWPIVGLCLFVFGSLVFGGLAYNLKAQGPLLGTDRAIAVALPAIGLNSPPYVKSIKDAARILLHQDTKPNFFLTMNDESKIEVETMLVMVSNTPVFGKNFLVAPRASLQDGLLDISVYPDFSKSELVRYYTAVMDGGYSGDGKVQHYQTRKLKVKSSPKLDVMADGVALGRGTVTIKVRPGALRVITTQKTAEGESPQEVAFENLPEPVPQPMASDHKVESVISLG